MALRIINPYDRPSAPWLKGNLHTHTTESDGPLSPQDTVDAYARRAYDFLMITDHDRITPVDNLDGRGMTLLTGNEISANGPDILHANARTVIAPEADRQAVINAINQDGGLAIIDHPNWEPSFCHCPQDCLEQWQDYAGIEIYNGVIEWLPGNPLATDRWDRLLAQGRRIWGYASDDGHRHDDFGVAWTMVQATPGDPNDIVDALRHGRFYASTGVAITAIAVDGRRITIETANAQSIAAYSDYAFREAVAEASTLAFTIPEGFAKHYVRFECWGSGRQQAWTQPFFIENA